jgi:hypothetical protein
MYAPVLQDSSYGLVENRPDGTDSLAYQWNTAPESFQELILVNLYLNNQQFGHPQNQTARSDPSQAASRQAEHCSGLLSLSNHYKMSHDHDLLDYCPSYCSKLLTLEFSSPSNSLLSLPQDQNMTFRARINHLKQKHKLTLDYEETVYGPSQAHGK